MEIIKKLTDLDAVKVSSHGVQESYFEPTAAQCSSCTGGQSSTAQAPARPKPVLLEAATVHGSLIGLASGRPSATAREVTGAPIPGLEIVFTVKDTGKEFGRGYTNAAGIAEISSGANIADVQTWASSLVGGYHARFFGNEQYLPAQAEGIFNPGIS